MLHNKWLTTGLKIALLLLILVFALSAWMQSRTTPAEPPLAFNDAWTCSSGEKTIQIDRFPFKLPFASYVSYFLKNTIPSGVTNQDVLLLFGSKSCFTVQIGDTVVYSAFDCSHQSLHQNNGFLFIPLKAEYASAPIEISCKNAPAYFPNLFQPLFIGEIPSVLQELLKINLPLIVLCVVTLAIGLLSITLCFYNYTMEEAACIKYTGWFLSIIAIWGLTNTKLLYLAIENPEILILLDTLPLLLLPIPIVLAFRSLTINPDFCKEQDCFFALYVVFLVCTFGLDYLGIFQIEQTAQWSLLLLFAFFVYVCIFDFVEVHAIAYFSETRRQLQSTLIRTVALSAVLTVLIIFSCGFGGLSRLLCITYAFIVCVLLTIGLYKGIYAMRKLKIDLEESRMHLMFSQIKPHFLYNTLNSIRTLIRIDPGAADDLLYNFSKFLRTNMLMVSNAELIPFSKELEHIQSYVKIEETCFPKLKVEYDIQIHNFNVPSFSIQPLVENAIKHGVLKRVNGGTVRVSSYETKRAYCIKIADDGVGFKGEDVSIKSDSCGLKNVETRLKHHCHATLKIYSAPGRGTVTIIQIPK